MATEAVLVRPAGPAGRIARHARALVVSIATLVIVASTLCTTAGALVWSGIALLGLPDLPSAIGGALAAAVPLPFVVWVTRHSYRLEVAGVFDGAAAPPESATPT
ncbi:MAG: hypothetical protein WD341_16680 [Tistlia sp.]|uniref:hypothetical protein n=1 Tax=Tistlia sp. TaxID=3057121 RepID=UPI0034A1253C